MQNEKLMEARHKNTKGLPIGMHHAFRTIGFTKYTLLTILLLPLCFELLLYWQIDNIIALWQKIFMFWSENTGFTAAIEKLPAKLLFPSADFPLPPFDAPLPTMEAVYINGVVTILLFFACFFFPERLLPLSYLLRAVFFIHFTSVVYFLFNPDHFPYLLSDHMSGGLGLGVYILFIIPLVLALIYYIFDLGLLRKILLTVLMLVYFIFFIPVQYFMHALLLHHFSLILLPVLYLVFGLLLDVLMCVALYSYAMSWKR